MKKILLSVLTLFMIAGGMPLTIDGATEPSPRRNYNCKMPRRDGQRPGEGPSQHPGDNRGQRPWESCNPAGLQDGRYLFSELGLSHKQYDRLVKCHVKYLRDMDGISKKLYYANPQKTKKLRTDAMRTETSFLNEVRRSMHPEQYRIFERRFKSAIPPMVVDSAPRPGQSSIGPVVKGPDPVLMTRERR